MAHSDNNVSENYSNAVSPIHRPYNWRLFLVLWTASVVGVILVLPYGWAMIPVKLSSKLPPLRILVPLQVMQGAVLLGLVTLAGVFIAGRCGLGAPLLEAWLMGKSISNRLKAIIIPSIFVGVLGTLLVLAIEVLLFQPAIRYQNAASASALDLWAQPAAWKGLLASFYGGIDEEILLRLFFLSLLAWGGRFLQRKPDCRPSTWMLWVANVITAVLFGLGHLPGTAAIVPLSGLIILRAIVLNGLLGLGFGYLYWTRGLESAALSHFSADLFLHVVLAL